MRLSRADDDFAMQGVRPDARPELRDRPTAFAPGEALALASALRFQAANAAISARDLDDALSRLSTRRLQALLSLERHSRPMTPPRPAPGN